MLSLMAREKRDKLVAMQVSPTEKAEIQRMANAEGVSMATFLYRRAFGKPDWRPNVGGRPPKSQQDEPLEGLSLTG